MSAKQNNQQDLTVLITGCKKGNRRSQRLLYEQYYGFAMAICLRYSDTYDRAVEVVNDGFLKIFIKLDMYSPDKSFKGWIRRIMINGAIDHFRKEQKHTRQNTLEHYEAASFAPTVIQKMSYDEVIHQIQLLSPSYRAVFNLYVIDGYKHLEISKLLNISIGTSKSNLSRAREQLQKALKKLYKDEFA